MALRIATFNAELSRKGSGLLLRDILKGDKQVEVEAVEAHRVGKFYRSARYLWLTISFCQ